jgi:solute carrier family 25 carnitine/acylcarnitine transporter 20/29
MPDSAHPREAKFMHVVRGIRAQQGWRGFYRGLSPALLAAFPSNAVTFVFYEWSSRLMQRFL